MIWVAWRQQRTESLIAAGILALLAVLLVPTGLDMASAYHHAGLTACAGHEASGSCGDAVRAFVSRFEQIGNVIAWLTLVPGLIGVLLAAPFALQLEHGTHRLDWTQSVTRGRWIGGKLGLAIAAALLAALAFTLLMVWWRAPLVHLQGRMEPGIFDSEGVVVFGYTLFALGLALAAGALWRRAVPSLVVGFAGYFAARLFVETWLRQRLLSSHTATWALDRAAPANLTHAWVLTGYPSDKSGHVAALPCPGIHGPGPRLTLLPKCLATQDVAGYMHAIYHPASSFWALQGLETGLFGGVAVVLIAFAAWRTHSHAA
jgi:hypothetical protein